MTLLLKGGWLLGGAGGCSAEAGGVAVAAGGIAGTGETSRGFSLWGFPAADASSAHPDGDQKEIATTRDAAMSLDMGAA